LTFTCLGSPLPLGRPPLPPMPASPPGAPSTAGSATCQEAMGSRKNQAALQPQDVTKNTCNSKDGIKRERGKETRPGRGREIQGIFLKEDSNKEGDDGSCGGKGLGRVTQFVHLETKSCFSPIPSGKGAWPDPRNTSRKTNVKGRDRDCPPLLSFGHSRSLTQQPSTRRNHSGKIHFSCHWANRSFLSLGNLLGALIRDHFCCQLMGLKRGCCPPGSQSPV
jgi:hypothetical protein